MPELAAQLHVRANLDLSDLFGGLAEEVLGVDLGDTTFDPGAILARVDGAQQPGLDGLRLSIDATVAAGASRVDVGLPGFTPPSALADLGAALGSLDDLIPDLEPPSRTGLDGLGVRVDAVRDAVTTGPVADLLALVPGLSWSDALGRLGGDVAGAVELLRVLAGLLATASASRELVDRTDRFGVLLDREQAELSAALLLAASADTALPADLRAADPDDAPAVEELTARVSAFAEGVSEVSLVWSQGMGYGEAALPFVDVAGTAAGLELARLALADADLAAVAALAAELRALGQPLLDLPLPAATGDGFAVRTARLVADLTVHVEGWDVAAALDPLTDLAALAVAPLTQFREVVARLEGEVTGGLRALRGVVGEIDLAPVASAVHEALRPVTDLLDGIEQEVAGAQATLTQIAQDVADGLDDLAETVGGVAGDLTTGLGEVDAALGELGLDQLAAALSEALRTVADALGSAELSPYFDTAIEVIGTAADVVGAIPFGMLPTDLQQTIVDACRPIKQLDLQEVEDRLRGELAAVREEFRGDLLEDVERAYGEVVGFLASLDPAPYLASLEAGPFAELRTMVDEVDPTALLEPVAAAITELRGLLDGLDLDAELLEPLRGVVQPVLDAIDELDPVALLAAVVEQVDGLRESVTGLLHLEAASEALHVFRDRAADLLDRIDPQGVASVLDAHLVDTLLRDTAGPPGGALGAVLVAVAETSGLRADEPAVQDVLDWVSGRSDAGPVVRGRIHTAATNVARVAADLTALDPGPVAAAATAYRRALTEAVAVHADGTALRLSVDPLLAGSPAESLGLLAANRQRYRLELDADGAILSTMSASGRTEVTEAAAGVAAALAPLAAFPARLRDALAAAGVDAARPDAGTALREMLLRLVVDARASGLTDALVALVEACRGKVLTAVDTVVGAGLDAVDAVGDLVALLDLDPVVAELTALHEQVRGEVAALTPDALLGDAVADAQQVVDRLHDFDPLAPVRVVVDTALEAADRVFESVRPTAVFAPAVTLHARVVGLAAGLDVVTLLRPVLDALDAIGGQLDSGFDRTGDALTGLQASLPDRVVENALDVAASVDIGVSL